MYFFTSDQHYGHKNIIKHCNRPYEDVEEMNQDLIKRHNSVVGVNDTVIHGGDFCFHGRSGDAGKIIGQLNGNHTFVRGNHDSWLPKSAIKMWSKRIEGQYIVVCHYALRVWNRSRYNSWQLHGHSHGELKPIGKQWDVGVDNNDYFPVSFEQMKLIMRNRPNNFDYGERQR